MSMTANQCLMRGRIFLAHWKHLESESGEALSLRDGSGRAAFEADLEAMEDAIGATHGAQDGESTSRASLSDVRGELLDLLRGFRQAVAFYLRDSPYAESLPTLPPLTSAEASFFKPFEAASARWAEIDSQSHGAVAGFTPPLVLRGGLTRAQFDAAIERGRDTHQSRTDHAETADSLQARRDARILPLRKKMTAYRDAVLFTFGGDSSHSQTLPTLE
jgi:hypothetical protein